MRELKFRNVPTILPHTESEPLPLDELFGAAVAERSARDRLREAQKAARSLPPESDLGAEANAIARQLLAQLEWREVALVAIIDEQICECGRVHFWLEGEYIERHHVRDRTAKWHQLRSGSSTVTLPRRIEYRTQKVKLCPSCVREHGYS